MRAEEERKIKIVQKQKERDDREKERRRRMLIREDKEAQVCNDLLLIYPLISYKH
jgi:hypothetical protein